MSSNGMEKDGTSVSENQFGSLNIQDNLHLSTQTQNNVQVQRYELAELFYENQSNQDPSLPIQSESINASPAESSSLQDLESDGIKEQKKSHSKSYKCGVCDRTFKEASHFTKHKRGALCRKEAQKIAKNKKKGLINMDTNEIKIKNKQIGPYKPYQCNICGAKFCDKVNVETHLERTHSTREQLWVEINKSTGFGCSECNLWFGDKLQLKQHQQQHQCCSINQTSINQDSLHSPSISMTQTQNSLIQPNISNVQYFTTATQAPHQMQAIPQNSISGPQFQHQQMQPHSNSLTLPIHQHVSQQSVLPQNSFLSEPGNYTHSTHMSNQSHPVPETMPAQHTHQIISNVCQSNNQVPLSQMSLPILPNLSDDISLKTSRILKSDKSMNETKWNVCGDCSEKFVDPMNLEVHIKRRHPNSNIIESKNVAGYTLYRTSNSINYNAIADEIQQETLEGVQTYTCAICYFKASEMLGMTDHLQRDHGTTNREFIYVMENLDSKKSNKGIKSNKKCDGLLKKALVESKHHICNACLKSFHSKAELIRHRVKDKIILCGVCNFSSCSDNQVAIHMLTFHRVNPRSAELDNKKDKILNKFSNQESVSHLDSCLVNQSNLINNGVESESHSASPSSLSCCICGFLSNSGVGLAEHLESHGGVEVQCGECKEIRNSFMAISEHINTSHSHKITRVTLKTRMMRTPTYMFLVTPSVNSQSSCSPSSSDLLNSSNSEESPTRLKDGINHCSELATAPNYSNENSQTMHVSPIYACSECGACLTGASQLEAHLLFHQSSSQSNTIQNLPSGSIILTRNVNTTEFRCSECGIWRLDSQEVMKHIQSVHMSGDMIHSQRLSSGDISTTIIHVFTPLSAMVSS